MRYCGWSSTLAVAEAVDPAVLEVAPEDAADADVLRQAGHAGTQARDAANDQVDLHASVAGGVQRLDHLGIADRVGLDRDPAVLAEAGLPLDQLEQPRAQVTRRHHQLVVAVAAAVAGEVVEQPGHVGADVDVAREDAEVLVQPGGLGVVVARADVAVAPELVAVVAHDEHALGVGLQPGHPVDDVNAGALELLGPVDVRGLVEARLELHQRGHLDASLGGADQAADDRAVATRSVERHLDRLHAWVVGGLADEGFGAAS